MFIVDRTKDMVLRGGENVYCSEVEAAIYEHPRRGRGRGLRRPRRPARRDRRARRSCSRPGVSLTEDATPRPNSARRLAKFKVPERVWFLNESLPRNANGKFVKRELRANLLAETA